MDRRTLRIRLRKEKQEFTRIVPIVSRFFWEVMGKYLRHIPYKHDRLFTQRGKPET